MTNLQSCVKAYRWNSQLESSVFAKEIGVTTRDYNRFEVGKLDTDTLLACFCMAGSKTNQRYPAPSIAN